MKKGFIKAVGALTAATFCLCAQAAYPDKPVRVVVNTAPGGLLDVITRLVAQKMTDELGQTLMVENRAGGDGLVGIRYVKSAAPDAYTLLATSGTVVIQPLLKPDAGYDVTKDFAPVGMVGQSPLLMVVGPQQPEKSLSDLITHIKADPDKYSYASAGVGTATHIAGAMVFQESGVNPLHVPYKGNAAGMSDVISGRVTTIFEALGSSSGSLKAGNLKALGITSAQRVAALPDVPTIAEQGHPGFNFYTYISLLAPAGAPAPALDKLSATLRKVLADPEVVARFNDYGIEALPSTPAEYAKYLEQDKARMIKTLATLGLTTP